MSTRFSWSPFMASSINDIAWGDVNGPWTRIEEDTSNRAIECLRKRRKNAYLKKLALTPPILPQHFGLREAKHVDEAFGAEDGVVAAGDHVAGQEASICNIKAGPSAYWEALFSGSIGSTDLEPRKRFPGDDFEHFLYRIHIRWGISKKSPSLKIRLTISK